MPEVLAVRVNGTPLQVPVGSTVAVAVMMAAQPCRRSVTGKPRGPLCAIGICFECRVTINGRPHCRSCQILCEPGMDVRTDG
jgi:sarcosine oxidase subunit alpha